MKRKYLFMAAVAVAALLTGCGPKEEPTDGAVLESIRITPSSISLLEGETYPLRIKYTPEEAKETAPAVIWYSERQRVASVDDNGLVTADRVGTTVITAQCGKLEATCIVDVLKNDLPTPDPDVKFSVEPKKIESPAEGGTFGISVKSNVAWTAEPENSEWATLNATSGEGDAELTLTVAGSEDPEVVSQDITFTAGKGKYYVRVTRTGYVKVTKFELDKTMAEVGLDGGTIVVNVEADEEWTVTYDATYAPHVTITQTATSATINVGKFALTTAQCNAIWTSGIEDSDKLGENFWVRRTHYFSVYFTCGEKTIRFDISQTLPYIHTEVTSGCDYNDIHTSDCHAHTFTVKVESNVPWKIDATYNTAASCGDANWMSVSQYSGTGDGLITVSFTDNSTSECDHREGKIIFTNTGGYTYFTRTYDTFQAGPNRKY